MTDIPTTPDNDFEVLCPEKHELPEPDNKPSSLRDRALALMRYANALTPYKLNEPLDPIVAGALDDWVAAITGLLPDKLPDPHQGTFELGKMYGFNAAIEQTHTNFAGRKNEKDN